MKTKKVTGALLKVILFVVNIYFWMFCFSQFNSAPSFSCGISFFADIFNLIFYSLLYKVKYNHYSYTKVNFSDRVLIRIMISLAMITPCSFFSSPVGIYIWVCIGIAFFPTKEQINLFLKCDDFNLELKKKKEILENS